MTRCLVGSNPKLLGQKSFWYGYVRSVLTLWSIGAELTALVDLTICKEFQTKKLTFEWLSRTAYCNISLSGSPTGLTHTDNHSVIKSSVLIWNLTYTHTIRENCTVLCSFSVKAGGMHL